MCQVFIHLLYFLARCLDLRLLFAETEAYGRKWPDFLKHVCWNRENGMSTSRNFYLILSQSIDLAKMFADLCSSFCQHCSDSSSDTWSSPGHNRHSTLQSHLDETKMCITRRISGQQLILHRSTQTKKYDRGINQTQIWQVVRHIGQMRENWVLVKKPGLLLGSEAEDETPF